MTDSYEQFKDKIYSLTGINLSAYKEKQMKRRIDTLIDRHRYTSYEEFYRSLVSERDNLLEFVNYLTINVSEFFRNPTQWDILDKRILPLLCASYGKHLRVWSAACSTGDEPYSLVMAMSNHVPLDDIHIYATDIDKQVIETAKEGIYQSKSILSVPDKMKEMYFTQKEDGYHISPQIKSKVEFHEHNLLKDLYPREYNLIVCRNVLIYFTEEAKEEIFKKFYDSLTPGGFLFIGSTEQMLNYRNIGFERYDSFFFVKPHRHRENN